MRNKFLLSTVAAMIAFGGAAHAERTVTTTRTVISPQPVPGANMVNIDNMDRNGDGVLTMEEVGGELFYLFDRDGNEIIDNREFTRSSMVTVAPVQKETVTIIDRGSDGIADETIYTYDTFLERTQLSKFAKGRNGLSPEEFIDTSFLRLDENDDKAVDIGEWREAYLAMAIPQSAEQERYNE